VVEGARLESVYTGNRIEGSNPSLSASTFTLLIYLAAEHSVCAAALPNLAGPPLTLPPPQTDVWVAFDPPNAASASGRLHFPALKKSACLADSILLVWPTYLSF
jgi:hypothetical protein